MIEEEKKTPKTTKNNDKVDLDVEKAKREDLKKQQTVFSIDKDSHKNTYQVPQKKEPLKSEIKAPSDPRKADNSTRRVETYKTTGSASNNKINDRNQKNAKDKDCIIY